MAIPATKNFELKKHRFFEGVFSNSRLGRVSGQVFEGVLQVTCKFIRGTESE